MKWTVCVYYVASPRSLWMLPIPFIYNFSDFRIFDRFSSPVLVLRFRITSVKCNVPTEKNSEILNDFITNRRILSVYLFKSLVIWKSAFGISI